MVTTLAAARLSRASGQKGWADTAADRPKRVAPTAHGRVSIATATGALLAAAAWSRVCIDKWLARRLVAM